MNKSAIMKSARAANAGMTGYEAWLSPGHLNPPAPTGTLEERLTRLHVFAHRAAEAASIGNIAPEDVLSAVRRDLSDILFGPGVDEDVKMRRRAIVRELNTE